MPLYRPVILCTERFEKNEKPLAVIAGRIQKEICTFVTEGKAILWNERRNRFKVTLRVSLCERRDTWPKAVHGSGILKV